VLGVGMVLISVRSFSLLESAILIFAAISIHIFLIVVPYNCFLIGVYFSGVAISVLI
jgi:hypothetical protein